MAPSIGATDLSQLSSLGSDFAAGVDTCSIKNQDHFLGDTRLSLAKPAFPMFVPTINSNDVTHTARGVGSSPGSSTVVATPSRST